MLAHRCGLTERDFIREQVPLAVSLLPKLLPRRQLFAVKFLLDRHHICHSVLQSFLKRLSLVRELDLLLDDDLVRLDGRVQVVD